MIKTLEQLLIYLYPDPPPPGILTRKNRNPRVLRRYEPHIIAAIEQAQRINRDNDYGNSGLCEFHIGIIYAYWNDFSGAGQQFTLARRQWQFAGQQTPVSPTQFATGYILESKFTKAICLTHFAEGYALESKFTYETALRAYKKSERCLLKLLQSDFASALQQELTAAQARIHAKLWNFPSLNKSHNRYSTTSATRTTPITSNKKILQLSPNSIPKRKQRACPIPDHTNDSSYQWYPLNRFTKDSQFSNTDANAHLLVNTSTQKTNELAFLKRKQVESVESLLKPCSPNIPFKRIYLTIANYTGPFIRNVNGIKLSSTQEKSDTIHSDIIGVGIGIWHTPIPTPKNQASLIKIGAYLTKLWRFLSRSQKHAISGNPTTIQKDRSTHIPPVPVPNHTNTGSHQWYHIEYLTRDCMFPNINTNTYLLINTDTTHIKTYKKNELLLIKNEHDSGSATLEPYPPKAIPSRIYLTEVIQTGTFDLDIFSGTVRFSPTRKKNGLRRPDIIGIVIGIWRKQTV